MRNGLFHRHWHPHHEGFDRVLLVLNVLILLIALAWCAWLLLTGQPSWNDFPKPEPLQFWRY